MPTTGLDHPILSFFLCSVENTTGMPAQPLEATQEQRASVAQKEEETAGRAQSLPKGVVLGPDGKP